jgi:hypothetical protein
MHPKKKPSHGIPTAGTANPHTNHSILYRIGGSHSGGYEEYSLLGYNAV